MKKLQEKNNVDQKEDCNHEDFKSTLNYLEQQGKEYKKLCSGFSSGERHFGNENFNNGYTTIYMKVDNGEVVGINYFNKPNHKGLILERYFEGDEVGNPSVSISLMYADGEFIIDLEKDLGFENASNMEVEKVLTMVNDKIIILNQTIINKKREKEEKIKKNITTMEMLDNGEADEILKMLSEEN